MHGKLAQGAHPRAIGDCVRSVGAVAEQREAVGDSGIADRCEHGLLAMIAAIWPVFCCAGHSEHIQREHAEGSAELCRQTARVVQLEAWLKL